ncbi:MAG: ATP-binding protein [Microlunatus sp.]
MGRPTLILVTGPAGSGKTTLAHDLARAIGCPALSRDEIKEGMVFSNPGFVPSTNDALTMRTYGLFFETISLLLRAEVTLVAEAAFQHRLWVQGLAGIGLEGVGDLATLRIVRCSVPEEVARTRQEQRLLTQSTRAAHADAQHLTEAAPFDPIHLDLPTLDIDTSDGWHPDLSTIADFCRSWL